MIDTHVTAVTPLVIGVELQGDRKYFVRILLNGEQLARRSIPRAVGAIAMALLDHVTVRGRVFQAEANVRATRNGGLN